MTCMTAFAETRAMTTTQLARAIQSRVIQCRDTTSRQLENTAERIPRMSWVAVTGQDGRRQLRILWR